MTNSDPSCTTCKAMEKTLARIKFEDLDVEEESCISELDGSGGEEGEEERETRLLFALQSRKGKKSGGFQSMGKPLLVSKNTHRMTSIS